MCSFIRARRVIASVFDRETRSGSRVASSAGASRWIRSRSPRCEGVRRRSLKSKSRFAEARKCCAPDVSYHQISGDSAAECAVRRGVLAAAERAESREARLLDRRTPRPFRRRNAANGEAPETLTARHATILDRVRPLSISRRERHRCSVVASPGSSPCLPSPRSTMPRFGPVHPRRELTARVHQRRARIHHPVRSPRRRVGACTPRASPCLPVTDLSGPRNRRWESARRRGRRPTGARETGWCGSARTRRRSVAGGRARWL